MATGVIQNMLDKPVTVNGINGTVEAASVIQEGKLVSGYIAISSLTAAKSAWINLCRISVRPSATLVAHAYLSSNGSDCGIIRFNSNENVVHIYPTQALSNHTINFMFAYRTT